MKLAQKYLHLNGEEYLIVHHKKLYNEIKQTIKSIDGTKYLIKQSKEKTMPGEMLYSPIALNKAFDNKFNKLNWHKTRYQYYITTDQNILTKLISLPYDQQKQFLISKGIREPISSFKQTDFVKDQVAVEVQFRKYAFAAFDLFVKHLLFYSGDMINLGVEVLPTKECNLK